MAMSEMMKWQKSNDKISEINSKLKAQGQEPMKRKRKKKTMERKSKKIKPKRTDSMMELLYNEHGITVAPNKPIVDYDGLPFL